MRGVQSQGYIEGVQDTVSKKYCTQDNCDEAASVSYVLPGSREYVCEFHFNQALELSQAKGFDLGGVRKLDAGVPYFLPIGHERAELEESISAVVKAIEGPLYVLERFTCRLPHELRGQLSTIYDQLRKMREMLILKDEEKVKYD